jgi:hypothetical protein
LVLLQRSQQLKQSQPFKNGSVIHFKFLQEESAKDPCLTEIAEALSTRLFTTFNSKALRMVSLANEVKSTGVAPALYLPASLKGKQPPSLTKTIVNKFEKNAVSPACPHVTASFEWYDHTHRPRPKRVKIKAHRFLFSSLVTKKDVKYSWLTASCLEVSIRYPDMMNYPVELVDLVTDDEDNQVFHENHPCIDAFEKDLEPRREHDGYCYETFKIDFEKNQDPQFLRISDKLNGFDLLRGKYLNSEDELCHFKILQIITKEKDEDEYREGEANLSNCEKTLRSMKGQQSEKNKSPFSKTPPKPDPVSSYGPTAEQQHQQHQQHRQIYELQARLQNALKLVETEQAAAQQAQVAAMQAKVKEEATTQQAKAQLDSLWQTAAQQQAVAQQAHEAAMQAKANEEATAQHAKAAIDYTNAQQSKMTQIQAEQASKQAAFEKQAIAQQAQAAQSAAQQHAAAQAAFEHSHAQQQQMAQMQVELAAAKRLSEETKAELAAAKRIATAQQQAAMENQAAPQVPRAAIGKEDERAEIERAKSKLAKRARTDDEDENRFPSLRAAASQLKDKGGLHGVDGFYPGVPAYVAGGEGKNTEDDMSTIDGGHSTAVLSLSSMIWN